MITRRFFISGIVTTAAVASASTVIPAIAPQLYATVYGVGWDFEPIAHELYEPMSVAHFGGTQAIDKFREVTEWVYAFEVKPLPETYRNSRGAYAIDPSIKWVKEVIVQDNGFTNIVGFKAIWDWQNSLRPDVARKYGDWECEWAKEQALAEQDYEANAAAYIQEALKA